MNIIAFDTSSSLLCATLLVHPESASDETRCFDLCIEDGLRHSEVLMDALDSLCRQAGLEKKAIHAVVCGKGPGSFTGLRIGMATAKGLAAALDCPLSSVSALDAMAWRKRDWPGLVVPCIDARKKRLYSAFYRDGRRRSDFLDLSADSLLTRLDASAKNETDTFPVLVTGPDADILSAELVAIRQTRSLELLITFDHAHREGFGRALAELGLEQIQAGVIDGPETGPEYVRSSDAELGVSPKKPAV